MGFKGLGGSRFRFGHQAYVCFGVLLARLKALKLLVCSKYFLEGFGT